MRFARRWLPAILFAAAVLAMAGPWAASRVTGRLVEPWFLRLGFSPDVALFLHHLVRKAGHVAAYAVFGLLALRGAAAGLPRLAPARSDASFRRARAFAALALGVALSCADESLQGLTPERGGSPIDVLVDTGGVAFGVAAGLAWARRRPRSPGGAPTEAAPREAVAGR
jgi:hypothetical protein